MKKQKTKAFGNTVYLLGKDSEGTQYYLEKPGFECGWYWGAGYVETYTNNEHPAMSRDIKSHQHFDILFFRGPSHGFDNFKSFFMETPLSDKELWKLMEIMKSIYTIKEYGEFIYRGGANYTSNPCQNIIKDDTEYKRINGVVMPALIDALDKILSEETE